MQHEHLGLVHHAAHLAVAYIADVVEQLLVLEELAVVFDHVTEHTCDLAAREVRFEVFEQG